MVIYIYRIMFSVGLKKKLLALSKGSSCRSLEGWIQGTSNHLYWCARAGGGNVQLTVDTWLSMHNHVVDIHDGHAGLYPRCLHDRILDGDWLDKGKSHPNIYFHKCTHEAVCAIYCRTKKYLILYIRFTRHLGIQKV